VWCFVWNSIGNQRLLPFARDNLLTAALQGIKDMLSKGMDIDFMKLQRLLCILTMVVGAAAPAFAHHMAVVVNHDTNVQNMSSPQLARIIKGDLKKWSDGKSVVLVLHGSSSGELATLEHLTKMTAADVSAMIASHKDAIRTVATDADVIDAVSSTPGAIGFVEEHSINDHVTVIKVDGRLPMEAGYLPH
jgi:hypothetical protein